MNKILIAFSDGGCSVGVYFKLQSFIFMPSSALNNGMIPIVTPLALRREEGSEKRIMATRARDIYILRGGHLCSIGLVVRFSCSPGPAL